MNLLRGDERNDDDEDDYLKENIDKRLALIFIIIIVPRS